MQPAAQEPLQENRLIVDLYKTVLHG